MLQIEQQAEATSAIKSPVQNEKKMVPSFQKAMKAHTKAFSQMKEFEP